MRDCPDDPLGALRAAPSSLAGLTPEARLARAAADERARAAAAEGLRLSTREPGVRECLSMLRATVARRIRRRP